MAIKISGETIIDDGRVIVDADKIGIGTTNPHVALEIFSGDVGIGTTDPNAEVLNTNTSKLAVGILTANQIFGPITGALNPTGSIIIDENLTVNGNTTLGNASGDALTVNATPTFKENATFEKDVQIDGVLTYEDVTNVDSIGLITARNGIHVLGVGVSVAGFSTFFNTVEFQDKVGIGTSLPDGLLTIQGDTDATTTPSIRLKDGTDTREVSISNSAGDFVTSTHGTDNVQHGFIKLFESGIFSVATGGTDERLRINSNGSIQVTPEGSTDNPYMLIDTSGDSVRFSAKKSSGNNEFRFLTQNSGSEDESLRITSDGDVGIGTINPTGTDALTSNNTTLAVGIVTANTFFGNLVGGFTDTGDVTISNDLSVNGSTTLQELVVETLQVNGISTFVGLSTFNDGIIVESGISTFNDNVIVGSGKSVGIGTDVIEAPLHVAGANSKGVVALFGAKDFVDNDNYNYDDATIGLQGENPPGTYQGAGVQYITRNPELTNWHHGYTTFDRIGDFHIGLGGLGNTKATDKITILSTGKVGIGTTNPDSGQLQVVGNGYHQINITNNKTADANKTAGISFLNYEGDITSVFQTFVNNSANIIYYGSADSSARGVQNHKFYVNSSTTATDNHALALSITSSKRVGINQDAPDAMLQVDYDEGSSEVGLRLRAYNATGSKTWQLSEINGNASVFTIRNATDSVNALNITRDGHVGIGTTDPNAEVENTNESKLAVGIVTANTFFGNLIGGISNTGDVTITGDLTVNGNTTLGDASSDTLTVNATPTFKEITTFEKDVDVATSIRHDGDTDTKISFDTDIIHFDTNNVERFRIDADGRVQINDNSKPASNADEGATFRVTGPPVIRNEYYSPHGHYFGAIGYTDNTNTKAWLAVDSAYAQSSAVSAGIFLSAFHQDAGGSDSGFTIKNLKDGNALVFSRVKTAASTNNPAVEEERVRIDSDGNVGIGTTIPRAKFDVRPGGHSGDGAITFNTGLGEVGSSNNAIQSINGDASALQPLGYRATEHIFATQAGEKLRITSDGNIHTNDQVRDSARLTLTKGHVGVSTILFLHNNNGSGTASKISSSRGLILSADFDANSGANESFMSFETDDNERVRITSVGKVCIAHNSALHSGNLQVSTSSEDAIDINAYSSTADEGGRLSFYRSKNASIGSNTIVANGDSLGRIDFRGYNSNGNSYDQGATIEAVVDGSVNASGDMPSALVFKTSGDGDAEPSERLRITKDGHLLRGGSGQNIGASNGRWGTGYFTTIDATSITGAVTGSIDKIQTQSVNTSSDHYLTFVDSNNASAAAESLYTNAGIKYKPDTNTLTVDGDLNVGGVLTFEDVTNVDSVGLITAREGLRVLSGSIGVDAGISTFAGINVDGSGGVPLIESATKLHIRTASNNNVVIGSVDLDFSNQEVVNTGNATVLNVGIVTANEYFGTFKGTIDSGVTAETANKVKIEGVNSDFTFKPVFVAVSGNSESLLIDDSAGITYNPYYNKLSLAGDITTEGQNNFVILNTTDPISQSASSGVAVGAASSDGDNYQLVIRNDGNTPDSCGIAFGVSSDIDAIGAAIIHQRQGGYSQGYLSFCTKSGTENNTGFEERMRITKDGDVGIGTTNPTGTEALTNNTATLAVGTLITNNITGSVGGEPVGSVIAWGGSSASIPSGYALCNGAQYNKTNSQYVALFNAIGYVHGGSGNNFNIPDLRDKFILGASNSTGDTTYPGVSPGATGGSADAIVPNHTHPTTVDGTKLFPAAGGTTFSYGGSGTYPGTVFTMSNPSNGEAVTNKNLPPYYALCYIIKVTTSVTPSEATRQVTVQNSGTNVSTNCTTLNFTTNLTASGSGSVVNIVASGGSGLSVDNKTASYTILSTDSGKLLTNNNNFSIGSGAVSDGLTNTNFSPGDVVSIHNKDSSQHEIIEGDGVELRFAGTALTGNRFISQRGIATIICLETHKYAISGVGLT